MPCTVINYSLIAVSRMGRINILFWEWRPLVKSVLKQNKNNISFKETLIKLLLQLITNKNLQYTVCSANKIKHPCAQLYQREGGGGGGAGGEEYRWLKTTHVQLPFTVPHCQDLMWCGLGFLYSKCYVLYNQFDFIWCRRFKVTISLYTVLYSIYIKVECIFLKL